ncbi:MAG: STAS domain-containing protein [Clostridiales bacterium]|jgi:stage II sporulation protein AA (anti-sigma F factor antagonist)|nr:STAS domain-containing protein [Clostridiales bacterium]
MAMTVCGEFLGGNFVLYISGEMDESNVRAAAAEFDRGIEKSPSAVVLDLSALTFIDSTGVGMILSRYGRLKSAGIPLYARGLRAQTEKVFRMSGLLGIIGIVG